VDSLGSTSSSSSTSTSFTPESQSDPNKHEQTSLQQLRLEQKDSRLLDKITEERNLLLLCLSEDKSNLDRIFTRHREILSRISGPQDMREMERGINFDSDQNQPKEEQPEKGPDSKPRQEDNRRPSVRNLKSFWEKNRLDAPNDSSKLPEPDKVKISSTKSSFRPKNVWTDS